MNPPQAFGKVTSSSIISYSHLFMFRLWLAKKIVRLHGGSIAANAIPCVSSDTTPSTSFSSTPPTSEAGIGIQYTLLLPARVIDTDVDMDDRLGLIIAKASTSAVSAMQATLNKVLAARLNRSPLRKETTESDTQLCIHDMPTKVPFREGPENAVIDYEPNHMVMLCNSVDSVENAFQVLKHPLSSSPPSFKLRMPPSSSSLLTTNTPSSSNGTIIQDSLSAQDVSNIPNKDMIGEVKDASLLVFEKEGDDSISGLAPQVVTAAVANVKNFTPKQRKNLNILVVDDSKLNRKVMVKLMQSLGFSYTIFHTVTSS